MGARNRGGIGLSYRPARLPGPHKHLKIRALSIKFTDPTVQLKPRNQPTITFLTFQHLNQTQTEPNAIKAPYSTNTSSYKRSENKDKVRRTQCKRSSKKLTRKGTLRQVFISVIDRIYPVSFVHSVMLVFST